MENRPTGGPGRNRTTLITAMLAMFLLGGIYAYGVLLPAIISSFHWSNAVANLPQSVLLFVYAVGMGVGGVLQDRFGPTRIALWGGLAFGLGLSLAGHATSLTMLVLSYGLLGGFGFGFAYVSAVTAAMRSYPHRRGLAAGLVVGSFGVGSAVWAPLAQYALQHTGWQGILLAFGLASLLLLPVLSLGIRTPHHAGDAASGHPIGAGMTLTESISTPIFWIVFLAYTLVTSAGLMWLNHFKIFGVTQGLSAVYAVWLVTLTAIGSGTGRVVFGGLSDRLGRFPSLIGASIIGTLLFALLAFGMPHPAIFIIAGLIGIVFGTWLSLYGPTSTDLFGLRAAGAIYGAMYLSYGIGGLIGPTLGGYFADQHQGGYRLAFIIAAIFCALGTMLFATAARIERFVYRHSPAREEEYPLE